MSEMQRRKESKKNKEDADVMGSSQPLKNQILSSEKSTPEKKRSQVEVIDIKGESNETYEELYKQFVLNLPSWIKAPWVYITPKLENQLETWTENWSGLILDYCRTTRIHIVNLEQLRVIHPFKNKSNNRGLTSQQMLFLADNLISRDLARWVEPKIRLRVFWVTEEELAMDLYNYMINTGKAIEYWTLFDLRKEGQVWSSLPIDELRDTIEVLNKKGLIRWLDEEKTTIEFIIA